MGNSETKNCMMIALVQLLKRKKYSDITILNITNEARLGRRTFYRHFKTKNEVVESICLDLIDNFSNRLLADDATTFETIMLSYFEFWEDNIELLLLLKKARLLYFIEENLEPLVARISKAVDHAPQYRENVMQLIEEYRYEFAFKLAGIWKLTLVWCEEEPRKTPNEMSNIIIGFAWNNHSR